MLLSNFPKTLGIVAGELVRKHGRNRDRALGAETLGWPTGPSLPSAVSYGAEIRLRVLLDHGWFRNQAFIWDV